MSQNPLEDPLTTKKHEQVVFISNLSEDVWPFIQAITNPQERTHEVDENANLADHQLFSVSDEADLVFITPKPFDPAYLKYYQELFGTRNLEILNPSTHTGQTSEDIINDPELFEKIVALADTAKRLTLLSYSTTFQFLTLAQKLRERGITVYTPEAPEEEDAWTVNFYGSKSGIRQLSQQSLVEEPDFMMADGLICTGIIDAARIAAKKYLKEDGVVIKTNKGHSGVGVLIFREGELPTEYHACEMAILKILQKDEYWDRFPIVIEDLINVNMAVGGGFPNIEFKVRKSGEVEVLYFCGLRVDKDGGFHGVEIHESVLNDRVEARVTDMGFFVGEEYARMGYRGYYDVDMVAAKNGDLYVSESNTRRTGGTHVYKTALKLIGKDFMSDSYVLSDNTYKLHSKALTFTQLLTVLEPVLFDKKTKEGVVLASDNLLRQGTLAYIIFGNTKKHSLDIEAKMFALLQTL